MEGNNGRNLIITRDDPRFEETLNSRIPPGQTFSNHYVMGVDGIMRSVSEQELEEYLLGGEYEERCEIAGIEDGVIYEYE